MNDLQHFQNVSAYKSFTLAAKMLGVSQPTLSESIRRLEADLQIILFYRSKSGIRLTPQGEHVLEKVNSLLNLKSDIETLSSSSKQTHHVFNIGCHHVVAGYFLTPFLQQLYLQYENIATNLVHAHSREIQRLIQEGKIDVGVVVNPTRNPDLIIKTLCRDQICIWQSKDKKGRADQLIADMQLTQVQSILRKWQGAPAKHIATNDFNLIGELVLGGMGYGILPERFVNQKKLKLKKVFVENHFKDELALVYRPEFGKSELEGHICKMLAKSFVS